MPVESSVHSELPPVKRRPILDPSAEEKKAFLIDLKKLNPKAAVVTTCFFLRYQPDPLPLRTLPPTISSLYHPSFSEMSHGDLLAECNQIFRSKLQSSVIARRVSVHGFIFHVSTLHHPLMGHGFALTVLAFVDSC